MDAVKKSSDDTTDMEPICKKRKLETDFTQDDLTEFRVVLVGKTGMGKSALGNSLLNKKVFCSRQSPISVTNKAASSKSEINVSSETRTLKVCDTPGMFDLSSHISEIIIPILECMTHSHPGPHIFLFVMKLDKITQEYIKTAEHFNDNFGNGVLKYTIVIFTGKDQLDDSLDDWLNEAYEKIPEFKKFIESCSYRYESINNKGSEDEKRRDVDRILQLIYKTITNNKGDVYYTNKMCDSARQFYQEKQRIDEREIEAELRNTIRQEIEAELRNTIRKEIEAELRNTIKQEIEAELRNTIKQEIEAELKEGIPEVGREIPIQLPDQKKTHQAEIKPVTRGRVRGPIKEPDNATLKKHIPNLMKIISDPNILILSLFARDVFDAADIEMINREIKDHCKEAGMGKLLTILLDCGQDAFQLFVECLRENNFKPALELLGLSGDKVENKKENKKENKENKELTEAIKKEENRKENKKENEELTEAIKKEENRKQNKEIIKTEEKDNEDGVKLSSTISHPLQNFTEIPPDVEDKYSTLHKCILNHHNELESVLLVKALIQDGADINSKDASDCTPLMIACKKGLTSVINLLLNHGADVSLVDYKGDTVLHYIVKNKHDDIIPCIERIINSGININTQNNDGKTPIHEAVNSNDHNIVKLLINAGCNINIPSLNGRTPLYSAIMQCVVKEHINVTRIITHMLLDAGSDVTFSSESGLNVLLQIVKNRNKKLIHLLIQYRADVLTQHERNKLQLVDIILRQNDLDLLESSLQSGLYINTLTDTGDNIFHLFAKVYFEYYNYNWLLDFGLDINHVNNLGNTPLMVAAFLNNKPFLKFVIEQQCNVNIQNAKGHTALYVCIIGFTFIKKKLSDKKINDVVTELCSFNYYPVYLQCVDVLLAAGTDVNIQDKSGKTVLMLAARTNDRKLLQKLLHAGANVNMLDYDEKSALQYVDFYDNGGDLNCFKLLLSNGGHHLLNLPGYDGTTIIQNMMLFPCIMPVEQTCSIIKLLVSNNVSLYKLAIISGDEYYNKISINELSSESRTVLRQLLFMSGAPRDEIMKVLNFDNTSDSGKLRREFNSYCNNLSLKALSRRIIRQNLGLGIQQKVLLLKVSQFPHLVEFILLKDILTNKYFNIYSFDDCGSVDDDNYDGYELDQDDQDFHDYNDKYYNQNLFYDGLVDDNDAG